MAHINRLVDAIRAGRFEPEKFQILDNIDSELSHLLQETERDAAAQRYVQSIYPEFPIMKLFRGGYSHHLFSVEDEKEKGIVLIMIPEEDVFLVKNVFPLSKEASSKITKEDILGIYDGTLRYYNFKNGEKREMHIHITHW
ncbi:MAG: hypothetical protein QXP53_03065 [Candidatus Pacearchaeota archaeon]